MPPYDPYVLKANALSFSGLNVQLAEGELTAFKNNDKFKLDAYGFSVDNGVTNMSWDHVRIAAGHATDFQAIIPAVEGNAQETTLQINNKIAFNMSGSYAYMNKDEVHIFDSNVSDTASYGTKLVLENASSHTLDIGTDGISFSPGYSTKISWPDILSAGLPFADSWLFAVNDNASYNTSTLVLNNTLNINDGTTDNVINITTVSEPSITLNQPGTSTSALSSVLNNTNLTFTDANTDGEYNNGFSVLNTTSLTLNNSSSATYSNDIAINAVDATVNIQTDNNGEFSFVHIAADGLTDSFTSADNFTLSTGIFNKTTLSRLSIFNDGSDPLTAVSDSFEITSSNSNMTFNLNESNPINNDSSALHSYQQVSKNSDGIYKSALDLSAFNATTNVSGSITLSAIDSESSITNPTINLKVTDSSTTVLESILANNLLSLKNTDTSLAYVSESLLINSSTYQSVYRTSETEANTVEISSVTTSIHLTETGTATNIVTSQLSRTTLEITDYNTTAALNNSKSAITSTAISTEQSPDGTNTYSVTLNSTDASILCSTPVDGTTDTVTINPASGFVKSFVSADTFSESGAFLSSSEIRSYDQFNDGTASTAFQRDFQVVTSGIDYTNLVMAMNNPVNGDSSRFTSGQQISLNGDGVYKSVASVETFNSGTNASGSITLSAIDTANSITIPTIKLDVTGTATSKPSGFFSTGELNITDANMSGEYDNSKTTVLSNNLSITRSKDGVENKTITMTNTSGFTTEFGITEEETNSDYKNVTLNTGGLNIAQTLSSLNQTNTAVVTPFIIKSTSEFDDGTNISVINSMEYNNNDPTNYLILNQSNPFTSDSATYNLFQQVSKGGDGVYKSMVAVESYNASANATNSLSFTAIDSNNGITIPTIKLGVTGTSTSKPSGYFSTSELNITDANTAGSYNNSKTTVLSNNLSITRTTDGTNLKAIAMNNTSGYATSFTINETETNYDYKLVVIEAGTLNFTQNLSSLHQTNYATVSPSLINSISTFDDSTTSSVTKSLSYTNNTSTNSFTLEGSNPFTENSATFTSTQRVSVGDDGGYNSAATVQYYNASTNITKSISLTAVDSIYSIVDPVIKVNDGAITSSLKSQSLSSTGDLSLSVVSGNELVLDVPSGADLKIGAGATSESADGGFTGLWMRVKIGTTYYKIPLMADLSIQDNSATINSFILDQLSKNVNALSVTDAYTLLLGKAVISYTGDREYWGPPQDTISSYVGLNNTSYLKLSAFDYVGWDFQSINFTNAGSLVGKIYIALWTDIVLTMRFNVVNTDIISGGNATEYKTTITTNNGSWTYVEVNLADFVFVKGDSAAAMSTVFSNIKQFLFATDTNVSNPVYIQYVALKRTA